MEKERLAREERLKRLEALRTAEEAVEQQEETTIPLPRSHLIEYHQFPWGTVERSVAEHERLLAEEARQVEEKVAEVVTASKKGNAVIAAAAAVFNCCYSTRGRCWKK